EIADGERVGLGRVVLHDDAEVLQHQEARALGACGEEQIGAVAAARERLAVGAADTGALPFGEAHAAGAGGGPEVETLTHHHLVAPGLAGTQPSFLRLLAVEAMRSGTESTTSRRPSPSKSTA